jgi:NAD-dependent SIR2 family protein deacetylase
MGFLGTLARVLDIRTNMTVITENIDSLINRAAAIIRHSDGLLIAAGAGMGVDSGLPDFRGDKGLWKAYPKLGQHRISFVEIANPDAFADNPRLAWGFYGHRLNSYRDIVPHEGFHILKRLAANCPYGYFVYTSNVDGQFQKAGYPDNRIVECHGSIHHLQCTSPCSRNIWEAKNLKVNVDEANCQLISPLPICPECKGLARPNILMFNDWGWISDRTELQYDCLHRWQSQVKNLAVIEMGAGIHVPAVRRTSESFGCPIIRINPAYPEVPNKRRDVGIAMGALATLQLIEAALKKTA